jgi:hypothetical protein
VHQTSPLAIRVNLITNSFDDIVCFAFRPKDRNNQFGLVLFGRLVNLVADLQALKLTHFKTYLASGKKRGKCSEQEFSRENWRD